MYHAILIVFIYLALVSSIGNLAWTVGRYFFKEITHEPPTATPITKFYAKLYRLIFPGAFFSEDDFEWAILACGVATVVGVFLALLWPVACLVSPLLVWMLFKEHEKNT